MHVHFPARAQLTGVTGATDTLTKAGHGLVDGQRVFFLGGTGFSGLAEGGLYYVRSATTDTLQLAATAGGSALTVGASSAGVLAAAVEVWDGAWASPGGSRERLDCAQAVQVREMFRAADAAIDGRDNRQRRLPLSAPRSFASVRLAEEFLLDHYESLAGSGPLHFALGAGEDVSARSRQATLESCTLRRAAGLVVLTDYLFLLEAPT